MDYDKSKGLLTAWGLAQTVKVQSVQASDVWRNETVKIAVVPVYMLDTKIMQAVKPTTEERKS